MRASLRPDGTLLLLLTAFVWPAVGELRVDQTMLKLHPQQTKQLIVTESIPNPRQADATFDFDRTHQATYASADERVVTITKGGQVRAVGAGQTRITVTHEGSSLNLEVHVGVPDAAPPVRFVPDVVPVLTKLSCNSGGCHGKATGQNGFKLSLLGFEPSEDYDAIARQAKGRRVFPSAPEKSLLLTKATGSVPHGGGRRLEKDSDDYRVLLRWIESGAPAPAESHPTLTRLEIEPKQRVLSNESLQQIAVRAFYSDGSQRDVTAQAVYQSNEPELAEVTAAGAVKTQKKNGLFAVMVRYGGKIRTFHGAIPFVTQPADQTTVETRLVELAEELKDSPVDRELVRGWQRLGLVPSQVASDEVFIRRVTVDICGTLPTPDEVKQFVSDTSPDKKAKLIDRLLERPEYAAFFALQWADILQNRGAGYSTSKQRPGTALFAGWIRDSLATNKPFDQFVAELLTASGNQAQNPPTVWYRSVRTSSDYVEAIAPVFLGTRLQCAQCHHHPFERWSQGDYYGLAAVFSRVGRKGGFADAEVPTEEWIYLKSRGEVKHPRTGAIVPPKALGGPKFQGNRFEDPRNQFARWLTRKENPYFARTLVNRMWAHFLGRGIIHPIDDARSTNPPTNPKLLDALAEQFIASGYDLKQLVRTICNSYAYGLAAETNKWNREDTQSYARFYPRRMKAEVLLDNLSEVLQVPTQFSGGPGKLPLGTRAIELPDENVPNHFLDVFGRPARTSSCDCERTDAPALSQALELINSTEIQRKLTAKDGLVAKLANNKLSHETNVTEIFVRCFSRAPSKQEMKTACEFLEGESNRKEAYGNLIWSLLATNEFLFNH